VSRHTPSVRIVAVADTHTFEADLGSIPDGDVFVHAGDLLRGGTLEELGPVAEWIRSLPHRHKIGIWRDHATCFVNVTTWECERRPTVLDIDREGMAGKTGPNDPDGRRPRDKVRELQRRLWAAAKRAPGRRFHALYDHVWRSDVLWESWKRVKANRGAAGIDGHSIRDVEEQGVERFLVCGKSARTV